MQTFLKTYDIELLSVIMSHISWEVIELINDLYSWIDRLLNNFRASWQAYIMDLQGHILLMIFHAKYKLEVNNTSIWFHSWLSNCYKILLMPWQHSCHGMCNIL